MSLTIYKGEKGRERNTIDRRPVGKAARAAFPHLWKGGSAPFFHICEPSIQVVPLGLSWSNPLILSWLCWWPTRCFVMVVAVGSETSKLAFGGILGRSSKKPRSVPSLDRDWWCIHEFLMDSIPSAVSCSNTSISIRKKQILDQFH